MKFTALKTLQQIIRIFMWRYTFTNKHETFANKRKTLTNKPETFAKKKTPRKFIKFALYLILGKKGNW